MSVVKRMAAGFRGNGNGKGRIGLVAMTALACAASSSVGAYPRAQAFQGQVSQSPAVAEAQSALDARIKSLGRGFSGDVSIAVKDVQTGFTSDWNGNVHCPQQSVSKFWVQLTALDKADRGEISLNAPVTVRKSDMVIFNQPMAGLIGPNGYTTTILDLMHRALQQSDNLANDFVLWKVGGPDAVRAFIGRKGITGVRFGPGERLLQSKIAGMEWKPSYVGANFYAARNAVPMNVRRAAFDRYVQDPIDGAAPLGVVDALAKLKRGELLSPQSTSLILGIMSHTKTGPQRLKGALQPGWTLSHKTGTGQVLGSVQAGYNDIGILTSPDGRSYSVAVMIRRTTTPLPVRMQLMQNVARAVIDFDRSTSGYSIARSDSASGSNRASN